MTSENPAPPTSPDPQRPPVPMEMKVVHSDELFAGSRVVIIAHAGALYRLQITARGRLILQK